jgi:hypothetical protein
MGMVRVVNEIGQDLLGGNTQFDSDDSNTSSQTMLEALERSCIFRQRMENMDTRKAVSSARSSWESVPVCSNSQFMLVSTMNTSQIPGAFQKRMFRIHTRKLSCLTDGRQTEIAPDIKQVIQLVQASSAYFSLVCTSARVLPDTEMGLANIAISLYKTLLAAALAVQDPQRHGSEQTVTPGFYGASAGGEYTAPVTRFEAPGGGGGNGGTRGGLQRTTSQDPQHQGHKPPDVEEFFSARHITCFTAMVSAAARWSRFLFLTGWLQPLTQELTEAEIHLLTSTWCVASCGQILTCLSVSVPHNTTLESDPAWGLNRGLLTAVVRWSLDLLRTELCGRWLSQGNDQVAVPGEVEEGNSLLFPPQQRLQRLQQRKSKHSGLVTVHTSEFQQHELVNQELAVSIDFFGGPGDDVRLPSSHELHTAICSGADDLPDHVAYALKNMPADVTDPDYRPLLALCIKIFNACNPWLRTYANSSKRRHFERERVCAVQCLREGLRVLSGEAELGDLDESQLFGDDERIPNEDSRYRAPERTPSPEAPSLPALQFHAAADTATNLRPLLIVALWTKANRDGLWERCTKKKKKVTSVAHDTIFQGYLPSEGLRPVAADELLFSQDHDKQPATPSDLTLGAQQGHRHKDMDDLTTVMCKLAGAPGLGMDVSRTVANRHVRALVECSILVYNPHTRLFTADTTQLLDHNPQLRHGVIAKLARELSSRSRNQLQRTPEYFLGDPLTESETYTIGELGFRGQGDHKPCSVSSTDSDMLAIHARCRPRDQAGMKAHVMLKEDEAKTTMYDMLMSARESAEAPVVSAARQVIAVMARSWVQKQHPDLEDEHHALAKRYAMLVEVGLKQPWLQYRCYCALMGLPHATTAKTYEERFSSISQRTTVVPARMKQREAQLKRVRDQVIDHALSQDAECTLLKRRKTGDAEVARLAQQVEDSAEQTLGMSDTFTPAAAYLMQMDQTSRTEFMERRLQNMQEDQDEGLLDPSSEVVLEDEASPPARTGMEQSSAFNAFLEVRSRGLEEGGMSRSSDTFARAMHEAAMEYMTHPPADADSADL